MTVHGTAAVGTAPIGRDLSRLELSVANRAARAIWNLAWLVLFRPTPIPLHAWRRQLLRLFGATIGKGARIYPGARIWAPWNLVLEDDSCIANGVDCYSVAEIRLNRGALVSQYSHLCSASHDYTHEDFPLVAAPILIGTRAWVAAGAFIGPGVRIGERAVVAARAVVVKDVGPWVVCGGNPAKAIKTYGILDDNGDSQRV
jgi:putative colanic acid biosynthesis acetyltransferase WcaF